MPIIRIIAAIVVPPLGVFLARGITAAFWISCLLTLLGWLPGVLFALYVVATTAE
jgi:uncharacterized membrane protein YqaE (UPF0057 family)